MRRRRRRRRNQQDTTKLILLIAVVGLAIYIGSATAVGNYISQKLIAPVLATLGKAPENEDIPTSSPAISLTPNQAQATPDERGEIRMEGSTLYAVQTGAFSSQKNAQTEADKISLLGGAGYIHYETHYRVFAAIYGTEQEALDVQRQLKDKNGLETSIYRIEIPAVAVKVIASQDQTSAIRQAFSIMDDAISSLMRLSIDIDKQAVTEDDARAELIELRDKLGEPAGALTDGGEIGSAVRDALGQGGLAVGEILDNKTSVAFSAKIKYNNIKIVYEYKGLLERITADL